MKKKKMVLNPYAFPWRIFLEVRPCLGEDQEHIGTARPSHDVIDYIAPNEGAEFYLLTNDFPKNEWENKDWIAWLKKQHARNVKIRVIGEEVEAKESLADLVRQGILEARLVCKTPTHHVGLLTSPKQIWFECYHPKKSNKAYACYFTPQPYEEIWRGYEIFFEEAWKIAEPISVKA